MHSLTFRIRRVCCHSNETHAPIANPPNSAQLGGTTYHSSKLHLGKCNSVGMRRGTVIQTHIQTDTQTSVANIHFAWLCLMRNANGHATDARSLEQSYIKRNVSAIEQRGRNVHRPRNCSIHASCCCADAAAVLLLQNRQRDGKTDRHTDIHTDTQTDVCANFTR